MLNPPIRWGVGLPHLLRPSRSPVWVLSVLLTMMTTDLAVAADAAAEARAEYDQVMALTPDPEQGARVYLTCAVCHRPEGWGTLDGSYPQIAGQHRTVIIKQLADIRAGNRDNPLMYPFSITRILGGAQNLADVAAYVASLPMTAHNGRGPGTDLELGGRLYEQHCVQCHGARGEGDPVEHVPAIAGQHFAYLMRQFDAIRIGLRQNSDPKMVKQIQGFGPREQSAVLDYSSRLPLPPEKVAPPGWTNPDFPGYVREQAMMPPPGVSTPGGASGMSEVDPAPATLD